jgi:hypothetical protein
MTKEEYSKKYKNFWDNPKEIWEKINKLYTKLGSVSFVHSTLSKNIRGLPMSPVSDAIY